MTSRRIYIWDLPTRLFHWALVVCVVGAVITAQIGGNYIEWHGKFGLAVVGLIAFRLVWGLVGSTYARFYQFFPMPAKVAAYLTGQWHGHGHNPLGAISVFGLLGLLAFQVGSGLFANDDIAFNGPLQALVGKDLSDQLTGWHKLASNVLIALVVLHIIAILFYAYVKKANLIKPMITGWKEGADGESARVGGLIVLALGVAATAVYGASGAWLPEPPPPPATEVPSW
ncbi:MAG: cytochrome b/b6 domain-containing protein [Thiotrichales bacterium]